MFDGSYEKAPNLPASSQNPRGSDSNKVLVVDDDDIIRNMLVRYLTEHGHSCIGAGTVDAALDIVRHDRDISIILSDLRLPGQSTTQAAALKASTQNGLEGKRQWYACW
jgi:CheY-like chemotaxis protein